jgi:ribose transport system ATP-binding protein
VDGREAVTDLLSITGLTKEFPGQRALDGVDFRVGRGEVVALCGVNGSGKSTLVKVLAGYHAPDAGELTAFGAPVGFRMGEPWRDRCHFVHQDLGLIPTMSTTDNLALAAGYATGRLGRVSWRRQRAIARAAIASFGARVDVDVPVGRLTLGERTIVAIARALIGWDDADAVLVLDEPTASLHREEIESLFEAIRTVAARGAGVVFVSHRLNEVLELAERTVVLRDGRVVADRDLRGLDADGIVELMVGRRIDELYTQPPTPRGEVVLAVDGLRGDRVRDLSFAVHRGEILGVTGLLGSGREELPGLLGGSVPRSGGDVRLVGRALAGGSVRAAIRHGLVLVPADRVRNAVVATRSVRENITLPRLGSVRRGWHIDRARERSDVREWMARLEVRPPDQERPIAQLSGGNQQKAVLAKWLRTEPTLLVLDEPTQGVDAGAKATIYRHLAAAAATGVAAVVCSNEAKDLSAVCDRVLVLRDGTLVADLHGAALTEERIVSESLGAPSGAGRVPT